MHELPVVISVNGRACQGIVEPRMTLADFLREICGLTGTHLGCEHGACGRARCCWMVRRCGPA